MTIAAVVIGGTSLTGGKGGVGGTLIGVAILALIQNALNLPQRVSVLHPTRAGTRDLHRRCHRHEPPPPLQVERRRPATRSATTNRAANKDDTWALFIGVDLGSSSMNAAAVDHLGVTRAQAERSYEFDSPQDGWLEVHPEKWWEITRIVMAETIRNIDAARQGYLDYAAS